MPDIRAFFFDLDGTLMDTERLYVKAVSQALVDRGCPLSESEAIDLVYGRAWSSVYEDSSARFPEAYPSIEAMEEVVYRHFLQMRDQIDICITDSIDLLCRLSETYPVAIVSGSPRRDIEEGIAIMGIADRLAFFLGVEDYAAGKPDPACFRTAAEQLGVPPAQCLVFEDSSVGIAAAKQAGMFAVALRRPGAPPQDVSRADAIHATLADFDLDEFMAGR